MASLGFVRNLVLVSRAMKVALSMAVSGSFLVASQALAQMDAPTRTVLIEKFDRVLLGLSPEDASYTGVSLRLADLLAERARVDAMTELEKGCVDCVAGVKDRQKALKLYESSLSQIPSEGQGKIVFQIGHLNELIGQTQKAESTYLSIIKKNESAPLVAEARAALGEMYFKQRRFSQAREQFEAARRGELSQKGLAAYRIAWCLFNEGKIKEASTELKSVLSDPKLLTRSGDGAIVSVDKQFQEEVSRDYATFLARLGQGAESVQELYDLSPEQNKIANIEFLATELERLGAKEKAIPVWQFSQQRQTQPRNRLEGHVRLAQLFMDSGKNTEAVVEFEKALGLWTETGCDQTCSELKSRIRKFVIDWHRISKKSPTVELLQAYNNYLAVFADDSEMTFWAAQLARELKASEKSMGLFQKYVELGLAKKAAGGLNTKDLSDLNKNIDNALLSQIEIAEQSGKLELQNVAYSRYLQFTPVGDRRVEVQYQQAHILYKQEKYGEAAEALRAVALLPVAQNSDIQIQAADLSLDALAILKDDARVESWAKEYGAKFPKKRSEFMSVARKSEFNQVATSVGSNQDPTAAWLVLSRIDIAGADDRDRAIYYKDKVILAEKLGKYSEARNATEALLKVPGLSKEDAEFGLAKSAWFAELALDFSTALAANQKLKMSELKPDQRQLRLAMFSELAGQNARPYYEDYIKSTPDKENARLVAARLVRESKTPEKDLARFEKFIKEDSKLYADLILEIYAKKPDIKILKSAVGNKALVGTPGGRQLARESLLKELLPVGEETASQVIGTKRQSEISNGIKKRVASIAKLEVLASRSLESNDWIAQVVGLSLLERETSRFYNELIALPIPEGLSAEEEGQYLQLLSQQAAPYQVKAKDIQTKVQEFWGGNGLSLVLADYQKLDGDVRSLTGRQLQILAKVAPDSQKTSILSAANSLQGSAAGAAGLPTVAEIEAARKVVLENPMNKDSLIKLSGIERQMGRLTLSSYLEARAQKAEGETK